MDSPNAANRHHHRQANPIWTCAKALEMLALMAETGAARWALRVYKVGMVGLWKPKGRAPFC